MALIAAVAVVPAAPAAAACTWRVTPLPVPAPAKYSYAVAHGVAPSGASIVGHVVRADGSGWDAVLWRSGILEVLPKPPFKGEGSNRAFIVNDQGVIAGVWWGDVNDPVRAWRYRNGVYEILPMPSWTMGISLAGINGAGDIIGGAHSILGNSEGLLWKAATPGYTSLGSSIMPVGIDDSGRIVLSTRVIVNPDGSRITLPRPVFMRLYDRGRILTEDLDRNTVVEWNISGQVVREFAGTFPHAVTTAGVMVAIQPGAARTVAVRNGSAWEQFASRISSAEGITETNVIVANFDHDGTVQTEPVAGTWLRGC